MKWIIKFMIMNWLIKEKQKYFEENHLWLLGALWKLFCFKTILPQLIGGSADLSGSNNTQTENSKIINSKNFGEITYTME